MLKHIRILGPLALILALGIAVPVAVSAKGRDQKSSQAPIRSSTTHNERYKIFYSPRVRRDTFLLDTATGRSWIFAEDRDKSTVLNRVRRFADALLPLFDVKESDVGRYTMTFSPLLEADTFITDSQEGRVWVLTESSSDGLSFQMLPHPEDIFTDR